MTLSQLEVDMVVLGDICRWSPSDVRAMSTSRRRRLVEVLVQRRSKQNAASAPDPSEPRRPLFKPPTQPRRVLFSREGRKVAR